MSRVWPLQDAKNRFSEVVERALEGEPQIVTRRGDEVVVVLAIEEFRRLSAPRPSLKDYLRRAPLADLELVRDRDAGRAVELP